MEIAITINVDLVLSSSKSCYTTKPISVLQMHSYLLSLFLMEELLGI